MKKTKSILLAMSVIAIFSFTGCYRSPFITYHEPHVYKGSDDPLLSKMGTQPLQEQLMERFRAVQTDR